MYGCACPGNPASKAAQGLSTGCLLLALITFHPMANPTRQWSVGSIEFTGNNSVPANKLMAVMETKPNRLWRISLFSPVKIRADLPSIEALYRQNGYLHARAALSKVEFDSSFGRVRITVAIDEGLPTFIDAIAFRGASVLATADLLKGIPIRVGSPLSYDEVAKGGDSIASLLMERGYLRASVPDSVRLDSTGRRGSIFFTIDQGPLCLCGPVGIQGLKSIRPWVVTRELAFKPGDTLTSKKIQTSIRNLYTTGLFTFVTITPQGAEGAPRIGVAVTPVAVTIDEAKSLTLDASLGYGTVDAFRTALGIAYGNVWSLGHTVSLNTATSRFGQRAELGYSLPWIFSHPVRVDASAYIERHEFNYHGLFEGVRLSLAPQRTGPISSRLWVQYEKTVYIHTFNDTVVEPKNTRSVGLEFTFDGRRNFAKRKFGMLVNLFPEIAGLGGRSSYQYYRSTFNAHFYLAPTQGFEFSPSLSVGYARGYGGSAGSLPPQARSYIGTDGLAPVRGYAVSVNGGAFTLVATPLDARFSIYKWIGVNAFVDGGHEWPDFRSARVGDMRWTAGPGISMRISIAQLRVDFPLYLNGSRGFAPPWLSIENTF